MADINTKSENHTKWVACWGTATSISDRKESTYAKDLTLRYPIDICFDGSALRLHFSNLTGTEPVTISKAYVALVSRAANADAASAASDSAANADAQQEAAMAYTPVPLTFSSAVSGTIEAGGELVCDALPFAVSAGDRIEVSMYFADFTQMNAGTLVTGPLSQGFFAYGDHCTERELPADLSRSTNWYWFLNTVDVLTEEKNHALICFGDSITAQSWPDYLALRVREEGYGNVSVIRRAVCGTRVLRQYSNISYLAYGLKGGTRFPVESEAAGALAVIIQHGINDIIHPVGVDVNPFRPWSDLPTCEDLCRGIEQLYVKHARNKGLKVYSGTLLPICGWRTYQPMRDELRNSFNDWLRTSSVFDGCVDFDAAVRDKENPLRFAEGFDSGDHLHPSEAAYRAMAMAVPDTLLK